MGLGHFYAEMFLRKSETSQINIYRKCKARETSRSFMARDGLPCWNLNCSWIVIGKGRSSSRWWSIVGSKRRRWFLTRRVETGQGKRKRVISVDWRNQIERRLLDSPLIVPSMLLFPELPHSDHYAGPMIQSECIYWSPSATSPFQHWLFFMLTLWKNFFMKILWEKLPLLCLF